MRSQGQATSTPEAGSLFIPDRSEIASRIQPWSNPACFFFCFVVAWPVGLDRFVVVIVRLALLGVGAPVDGAQLEHPRAGRGGRGLDGRSGREGRAAAARGGGGGGTALGAGTLGARVRLGDGGGEGEELGGRRGDVRTAHLGGEGEELALAGHFGCVVWLGCRGDGWCTWCWYKYAVGDRRRLAYK